MNSRQRVVTALNHNEPDRVPIDIGGTGATTLLIPTYEALIKFLGINKKILIVSRFFRMAYLEEEILKKLGQRGIAATNCMCLLIVAAFRLTSAQ